MLPDALPADDPERLAAARPWRQRAWERIPGWARIGITALLVLAVLHLALFARIWYGLQDPPEVAAIRKPGRHLHINAQINTSLNPFNPMNWGEAVAVGLRGTSAQDVTAVFLAEHATDELVAYIAEHFPNVNSLQFQQGQVTSQGLMALKACPQLQILDVSDTNVDDGLAELLPHLPKLTHLRVMNTTVSDKFTIAAAKHNRLAHCRIEGTNISPNAARIWKSAQQNCDIQTDWVCCRFYGIIRWSNGEMTRRFSGPYEIRWNAVQLIDETSKASLSRSFCSTDLGPDNLLRLGSGFRDDPDGTYQISLKLGDIASEPIDYKLTDGRAYPYEIVFRMPVTQAEAFERLLKEDHCK